MKPLEGAGSRAWQGAPPHATVDGAFQAAVRLHMAALLRTAAALVGLADAEDVAQEAIVRAWQAWPELRDPASVRGWLLTITVHLCLDWQRGRFGKRRQRDTSLDSYTADDALARIDADPGTSDAAASLDLRAAVNALAPELRVVVALRHYAGLDSTEIGTLLGVPAATVRTRLRRALAILRDRLGATEGYAWGRERGRAWEGGW